jgi:hypothetical protein
MIFWLEIFEEQCKEELHGGVEPSNAVNVEAQRWHEERLKGKKNMTLIGIMVFFANAPTLAVL